MEIVQIIIAVIATWGVLLTPLWFPWFSGAAASWYDAIISAALTLGKYSVDGIKIIAHDLQVQCRTLHSSKLLEEEAKRLEAVAYVRYLAVLSQPLPLVFSGITARGAGEALTPVFNSSSVEPYKPQPCYEEMLVPYPEGE